MGSEDVIHNVYVPAFRVKQDVVPGRLTTVWFEATKTGSFHLFCNQYCGKDHSRMVGKVIVMEPNEFQAWLAGDTGLPPVASGELLFSQLACNSCHAGDGMLRGPSLAGLAGSKVTLLGGGTVIADDDYIRESIINPAAKIVDGYQPIMPTFKGLVTEEQLLHLVAYIKSLEAEGGSKTGAGAATPANPVAADTATTAAQ
jgi:cytochrome c oxidase subunit 2